MARPVRLADLLAEILDAPAFEEDSRPIVPALRRQLDAAAADATATLDGDDLPLRLPKDRIARVLTCEQLSVATTSPSSLTEAVVRGRVLDRLLHHHIHAAAPVGERALAVAESAFAAERDDGVLAWLRADEAATARLEEDAAAFSDRLGELGPIPAAWWPRCEDRVRVDLAGARVACSARLDLVLGGPPTDLPMVVLEAKSGRFGAEHRDGLIWYALLAALRHGEPPRAVVGWSAWDGGIWWLPVREAELRSSADRANAAIDRLGALARGRAPERTPSRACSWCPERVHCDEAMVDEDDDAA